MVQRNDLTDLLIAPMQHQCHYQLLLEVSCLSDLLMVNLSVPTQNVLKATSEPSEKSLLTSAIKAFVVALSERESASCVIGNDVLCFCRRVTGKHHSPAEVRGAT